MLLLVIAHLDSDVRVGVTVVKVAPLFLFVEFDEDLFIVPGSGGGVGVPFFIPLELRELFLGMVGVVGLNQFDDAFWAVFQPLDIKGDLCCKLVFGCFCGGIGIGVVLGQRCPQVMTTRLPVLDWM